ncbi:MAG: hypothetical protein ACI8ZB_000795 [Desulforhopalus sp.]|jgi:hypothetical protein
MESANASLTDLSDIVLPAPIEFWPLGQGAYLLLIAILISVGLLAYLYVGHQRANRYRRIGLKLLATAQSVYDVSVVLKRVALAAFPRERVASLYGASWVEFLNQTCADCNLESLDLNGENMAEKDLITAAGFWIRNHNVYPKG